MTPAFIPGLRLARLMYEEAVCPILERRFPGLRYAAALLGTGSEVQGFDTPMSRDHDWGPRLLLFLADNPDFHERRDAVHEALRQDLPREIHGYPTSFSGPDAENTTLMAPTTQGPVEHRVEIITLPRFLSDRLGITGYQHLSPIDWLLFPSQRLREVAYGEIFYDGLGQVGAMRDHMHQYPYTVWLYLMAAQWARIGQLEPFVGRCGDVGDDAGSALVTASQVRDLMRLCFLLEGVYAPYPKWFGVAFARLSCAPRMLPHLNAALHAAAWQDREAALSTAYEEAARMHNALSITEPLPVHVRRFHDRPFLVIGGERFSQAVHARIDDPVLRDLPDIGSIDQFVDSTDVLSYTERFTRLRVMFAT